MAAVVAAPAAVSAYVFASMDDGVSTVEPAATPVFTRSTEVVDDQAASVEVSIRWRSGRTVLAPDWSGLVTAVLVSPGDAVGEGQPLFAVDGIDRIAAVVDQPFFRDIGPTTAGADVAQLNALLGRLGLRSGAGSTWTRRTAEGTAALRARLGLPPAPPAELAFDPAWVVRIPEAGLVVGSVPVRVGVSAPPVGEAVLEERERIAGATLRPADGEALPDKGPAVLAVGKGSLDLSEDGAVDAEQLAALAMLVPLGGDTAEGTVRLADPKPATVVPASAVVVDPETSEQCLFAAGTDGPRTIKVEATQSSVGSVDVGDGIAPGTRVLVNPLEVDPERGCRP